MSAAAGAHGWGAYVRVWMCPPLRVQKPKGLPSQRLNCNVYKLKR